MRYFIIEHPTAGVLMDLEETEGGNTGRFSWTGLRGDDDNMRFYDIRNAVRARRTITPASKQAKCQIRSNERNWPVVG